MTMLLSLFTWRRPLDWYSRRLRFLFWMFVTAGADNFNSFGAWPNFLTVLYRADILKIRKNAINTANK